MLSQKRWVVMSLGVAVLLSAMVLAQWKAPLAILGAAWGVAALLLGLSVRPWDREEGGVRAEKTWRPKAVWAMITTSLAILLVWEGLGRFQGPAAEHAQAWHLYWLGLAVLIIGFLPWGPHRAVASERPTRSEVLALILILVVAGVFRFHELGTRPYGVWFDEAQNGLEALRILHQEQYRPVFVPGQSQMPAMLFYYFSYLIEWFGASITTLRLGTTLVGLAAVVSVWLLARQLFGATVGLLAASLLAVCRWHVNFSRLAMAIISASFFVPLVLFLFVRSQRRESPRDAVFAGLVMGIGLQFYYSLITVPIIMVLTFAHRFIVGRSRSFAGVALLLLTLGVTALSYSPVYQYARAEPEKFSERMRRVSITKSTSILETTQLILHPSPRRTQFFDDLTENLGAHARMFHLLGDRNGRHNLPGEPMLEPITGAFFVVGLLWCAALFYEPRASMLLVWFGAMLASGIFSLTFEAPQGARTMGVTSVICIMAGLGVGRLVLGIAPEGSGSGRKAVGAALAIAIVSFAGYHSWTTYFHRQLSNPAVWAAWSTQETKIAHTLLEAGPNVDSYVPTTLSGSPTERFILGRPSHSHTFQRSRDLPLPPLGRDAVVFLEGNERQAKDLLARLYPRARIEPFGPPLPSGRQADAVMWVVRVPDSDIERLRGWIISYRRDGEEPIEEHTVSSVWKWNRAPVHPPFQAAVRGVLKVSHDGQYRMEMTGDTPRTTFAINGEQILSLPDRSARDVTLARGHHEVELIVQVESQESTTRLTWQGPDATNQQPLSSAQMFHFDGSLGGLQGYYYPSRGWEGSPAFLQIDPQINFYFHIPPLQRPFSIRWTGSIYAPEDGIYSFDATAIVTFHLMIGDQVVLSNESNPGSLSGGIQLAKGWHPLEARYQTWEGYSQVYLYWRPPGGARELVPPVVLRPPGPGNRFLSLQAPAPDLPPPTLPTLLEDSEPLPTWGGLRVIRSLKAESNGFFRLVASAGDRLYLLDGQRKRIMGFEGTSSAFEFGESLEDPSDLEVDDQGRIHALDAVGWIHVFEPVGSLHHSVDIRPLAPYNPRGLGLGRGNARYVIADTGLSRILVCDERGRLIRTLGSAGEEPGQFQQPTDVAVVGSRGIVVTDAGNNRVQRLDETGKPVAQWARPGGRPGPVSSRLTQDAQGNVWVAGGESREIWRLPAGDASGVEVFQGPESFFLADLSFSPDGSLYLLQRNTGKILQVSP